MECNETENRQAVHGAGCGADLERRRAAGLQSVGCCPGRKGFAGSIGRAGADHAKDHYGAPAGKRDRSPAAGAGPGAGDDHRRGGGA